MFLLRAHADKYTDMPRGHRYSFVLISLDECNNERQHAAEAIRGVIGEQKAEDLFALARVYWVKGGEGMTKSDKTNATEPEITAAAGPNAIPKDTRVVVNIPAFRMDVFQNGSLVKSYKIGIGYPDFPLPTGLRKAETIIFNPTWTPPDEPWVAGMKGVAVGQSVAAGSKLNPLGPIKIPIGAPSLIHGGKPLAKLCLEAIICRNRPAQATKQPADNKSHHSSHESI